MFKFVKKPDESKLKELKKYYKKKYKKEKLDEAKGELQVIKSELVRSGNEFILSVFVTSVVALFTFLLMGFIQLNSEVPPQEKITVLVNDVRFVLMNFAIVMAGSIVGISILQYYRSNQKQLLKMKELVLEERIQAIIKKEEEDIKQKEEAKRRVDEEKIKKRNEVAVASSPSVGLSPLLSLVICFSRRKSKKKNNRK